MNVHGLLVVFVVALMVSAGAGAAATGTGGTDTTITETATETETETEPANYDADASYDNGTVTFVVTENGSAVEGLDVGVDGESVGATDAHGTVTFDSNESRIEIEIAGENVTGEFEYERANGSLTLVEGEFESVEDEDDTEARGPPTDMPEQANDCVCRIHATINAFLDGELDEDTTLGAALSDIISQKKDASERGAPADTGKPDNAGKPDDVGQSDDADDGEESDDAENDEDDEDEDGDDDSNGKSDDRGNRGNGNGNGRP